MATGAEGEGRERPDAAPAHDEIVERLLRRIGVADKILAGLASDMQAAGASSATERTERARTELHAAHADAEKLRAPTTPDGPTH